jgi:hypothetical protein
MLANPEAREALSRDGKPGDEIQDKSQDKSRDDKSRNPETDGTYPNFPDLWITMFNRP